MIGRDTTFLVQAEVQEKDGHRAALAFLRREIVGRNRQAALAPQVLSEFVHIVTDGRRFERPLTIANALAKAGLWWNAAEVERVLPDEQAVGQFLAWMHEHRLGRKRLLDTMLAATYYRSGVTRIVTSNARDYRVFGVFEMTEV